MSQDVCNGSAEAVVVRDAAYFAGGKCDIEHGVILG